MAKSNKKVTPKKKKPTPIKITDKHKLFCTNLLKHKFNQSKAYQETYPSHDPKSARIRASELVTKSNIKAYLETLKKKFGIDDIISVEDILHNIMEVYDRCMQHEPAMVYDKSLKAMVETGEYVFKELGALKALELLGKYKKMYTDKVSLTGDLTLSIDEPPPPEAEPESEEGDE